MQVHNPGLIGIWRCWSLWRRETLEPEEKPSEQGESQQQTQPTSGNGVKLKSGQASVRWALSPLSHPCSLV